MDQLQPIWDIAEICHQLGVEDVVLSPGSRCAPLVLAFNRHKKINCITVPDERSAAFIGLGIAQKTKRPVVLVCTSGSAGLNYYPAIAEAFYQNIPLVAITADRPTEWVDQGDGQTIRQQGMYANHILKSYQLPVDTTHADAKWELQRKVNEAINVANNTKGPVHINLPVREPFYPAADYEIRYTDNLKVQQTLIASSKLEALQLNHLKEVLKNKEKVLVVVGQNREDEALSRALSKQFCPVLKDNLSNVSDARNTISHFDLILANENSDSLRPDLVIKIGGAVLSKRLKQFLRSTDADVWNVNLDARQEDVFQNLTQHVATSPLDFFDQLSITTSENYFNAWQIKNDAVKNKLQNYFQKDGFSEMHALWSFTKKVSVDDTVHLANSMSVRYMNLWPLKVKEALSNRGTSGIDGSVSTACGFSFAADEVNYLVTGDLSLFYDRNGLWHQNLPSNFRILLLNNHGGGIFNMIPGPRQQKEGRAFFVTEQRLQANYLAAESGFDYQLVNDKTQLKTALDWFTSSESRNCLLEIETDINDNTAVFQEFMSLFK